MAFFVGAAIFACQQCSKQSAQVRDDRSISSTTPGTLEVFAVLVQRELESVLIVAIQGLKNCQLK